ncbi:uncharacterized protein PHALS_09653 [Plasmopara halstedii]|uniref:Uncharacterized protein n=1 Tax=Plasmopara halstedii TaxID=4781 RepID=A0A0P1AFC6_PLAHL|nr:uncharacterized protein PHALS_09653 [Plasmopara halstedii]CEG39404.1 hypothetical protein PHALS_09653 [Plasmopara halstedii]|eukprot:XP_024575773.1 hypothetical protein PHALS_09653 [Plasmopara halstedii]
MGTSFVKSYVPEFSIVTCRKGGDARPVAISVNTYLIQLIQHQRNKYLPFRKILHHKESRDKVQNHLILLETLVSIRH